MSRPKNDVPKCRPSALETGMDSDEHNAPTLEFRAWSAVADLLQRTSGAPARHEMESLLVKFAREFGFDVGTRFVNSSDSDGAAFAVRNAVDRAAKGEP